MYDLGDGGIAGGIHIRTENLGGILKFETKI